MALHFLIVHMKQKILAVIRNFVIMVSSPYQAGLVDLITVPTRAKGGKLHEHL
jgi:hypothetical protein